MRILFIAIVVLAAVGLYSAYEIVSEIRLANGAGHPARLEGLSVNR